MKTILVAMIVLAVIGCTSSREIQVEMVRVELIKIDTVFRHEAELKQLTWKDQDNVRYISFADLNHAYVLGLRSTVMRHR